MVNAEGQTPCDVAAYLIGPCLPVASGEFLKCCQSYWIDTVRHRCGGVWVVDNNEGRLLQASGTWESFSKPVRVQHGPVLYARGLWHVSEPVLCFVRAFALDTPPNT